MYDTTINSSQGLDILKTESSRVQNKSKHCSNIARTYLPALWAKSSYGTFQSVCQKSADRKSLKKYFSYFVLMSGLGLEPWLFV